MPPTLHEAGTRLAVRFLKNIRHRTERMALEHVRAPFSWHEGRVQDLCEDIDACLDFLAPAGSSMTVPLYELTRVPSTAAVKAQTLRAEYFTELREAVQSAVELYDEPEPEVWCLHPAQVRKGADGGADRLLPSDLPRSPSPQPGDGEAAAWGQLEPPPRLPQKGTKNAAKAC